MRASTPPALADFSSCLIVKPSSLGDIVHTLPAVHLLKQAAPNTQFRWICNTEWMPILEGNSDLEEIIPFPRQKFRGAFGPLKFLLWTQRLKKDLREHPELILDFQGLLRSGIITKSQPGLGLGLSNAREGAGYFYDGVIHCEPQAHAVDRYLQIPKSFGLDISNPTFPLPQGQCPSKLDLPERYILVHPSSRGTGKSLSPSQLQTLCDCLAPNPVILVGKQDPLPQIRGKHLIQLMNETSINELLWIIRNASACISVDSGPMHLAAAYNVPLLSIHTWSNPRLVGPYAGNSKVWKAGRIANRQEFSDKEIHQHQVPADHDARRMADHILRIWHRG